MKTLVATSRTFLPQEMPTAQYCQTDTVSEYGLPPQSIPFPANTISLTYDDGPDAYTLELASYLNQKGIRATFFINGCRIQGHPVCSPSDTTQYPESWLREMAAKGHRIGNHTENHTLLTADAPARRRQQLGATQQLIDPHIRDGYFLVRAPSNCWNASVAETINADPYLSKLEGTFGYDSSSADWDCPTSKTPGQCAQDIVTVLPPGRNGIIQLHDRNVAPGSDYTLKLTKCLVEGVSDPSVGCPSALLPGVTYVPLDALAGIRGQFSFATPVVVTTEFSDNTAWPSLFGYYGTVRAGDINGDGHTDVCARGPDGVRCALSQSGTFSAATLWHAGLSDNLGWLPPEYSTTLQLGDVDHDGNADLCARGVDGLYCYKSNGQNGFAAQLTWWAGMFSDANGWNAEESRYGSIHLADIDADGDLDACGRAPDGIVCALFNGSAFGALQTWASDFRDDMGWAPARYGSTLRFADLNADGKADVCGRGVNGLRCLVSNGTAFVNGTNWSWPAFADVEGWHTSRARYRSIQLADVDGDGRADACGRNATGIVCAFSDGAIFDRTRHVYNSDFIDANGWGLDKYGSTVMLADINNDGHADVCGRGAYGIACARAP
ncbi:FG-GAP-like repeat-containing protein [Myxococcus sp. K15C18031901]|uniref:polysaccharide deacetylase family protein n=1 Tax=Myxococcus dinghuensis TaxID=2906761 RepID=UPI0020A7C72F|nr:polysaccharide deacetylase family protein [Myxococcus dinghuensis]MCP3105381.1 FG-GAP-like repeat-containing protein [Myxococcus dinghuensis]